MNTEYIPLWKHFLGSDGFLTVSKIMLKRLGLKNAVVLSNLIDKQIYFEKHHPEHEGWFYHTHANQIEQVGITERSLVKAKRELIELGFISTKKMGLPSKEWYKIDIEKILQFLSLDPPKTGGLETSETGGLIKDIKQSDNNVNISKDISFINDSYESSSVSSVTPKRRTLPPKAIEPPKVETPSITKRMPSYLFVSSWNNEPAAPVKHNLEKSTKTLDKVKRYYTQLINGSFFRKSWDIDWLNRHPEITAWVKENKAFTKNELEQGLKAAFLYYMDGYWPEQKNNLPRNLSDLLYNPATKKSWFLMALAKPPGKVKGGIFVKELYPYATEQMLAAAGAPRTAATVHTADAAVRRLYKAWDITTEVYDINNTVSGDDFYRTYPTGEAFVLGYLAWLQDEEWIKEITMSCFAPGAMLMHRWFQKLQGEFDYGDEGFRIRESS